MNLASFKISRFLLGLLLCLLPAAPALALEYEVDGQIEQTLYWPDGRVGGLEQSQFTVFVKDCSWLIQTPTLGKDGKPVFMRETGCTNGAEVWEVAGPVTDGNTADGQHSLSRNLATIVSNSIPVGQRMGYFVCHIWMMYASGCYFASLTNDLVTPVYDVNASVNVNPNLKREAKWELVNGPGSLPLNVVFLDNVRDGYGHAQVLTNATYTATGVTNAGTLKIPSGFIFEGRDLYYGAPGPILPGETTPAYHIRKRAVATVTAVRPYCSRSDLSPTATGKTIVIDERSPKYLTQPNNLPTYIVQSGVQWLPYAQAQKSYVVPRTATKPPSRGVVAIILLLPTAVFLSFLWLNRKKR